MSRYVLLSITHNMFNGFMSSSSLSKSVTTLLCCMETGGVSAPEWQKLTGEDISARSSQFFVSFPNWLVEWRRFILCHLHPFTVGLKALSHNMNVVKRKPTEVGLYSECLTSLAWGLHFHLLVNGGEPPGIWEAGPGLLQGAGLPAGGPEALAVRVCLLLARNQAL